MDRTAIINDYVTDMAAVETHILAAVERQVEHADTQRYPEALRALTDVRDTLRRHVAALESYNDRTEGGTLKEAVKEAVTGALGVAAGIYNQLRQEDAVSRSVRDTYTALGLANVSYHMLHTTALALKEQRLADLALSHLRDLAPLTVKLSEVVCLVVARELTDEDKTLDPNVGQQALRQTHAVWREVGSSGDGGSPMEAPVVGSTMTPGTPSGTGGQGF